MSDDNGLQGIDMGDDLETARTNFNACNAEVHHSRRQLELAYQALVGAAEQYGAALAREEAKS